MTGTRKSGTSSKPAKRAKPKVEPATFVGEVGSGDRRRALEALRDRLAADLDVAPVTVAAQIAGQLRAVLADIAGLPGVVERSASDDLAKRRKARRAAAAKMVGT